MRMSTKLLTVLICGLMLSMTAGTVGADTFEIGEKVSEFTEGPMKKIYFDSGAWLYSATDIVDHSVALFDNNLTTGMSHNTGGGPNARTIYLFFPEPLFVTDIMVYPSFGGGSTEYTLYLWIDTSGTYTVTIAMSVVDPNMATYAVNATVTALELLLDTGGSDQYDFNEVVINHAPTATDVINDRLDGIEDGMADLTARLDALELAVSDMNATQQSILENITALWAAYDELNATLHAFMDDYDAYNDTALVENLTKLQDEILAIQTQLQDMNFNDTNLEGLEEAIDQTTLEVTYLNENITALRASIPDEFNSTELEERIAELEAENAALRFNNTALDGRITQLEAEIVDQAEEIQDLREEDDEGAEGMLYTLPMIISILTLIIVMAILAYWASGPSKGKDDGKGPRDTDGDEE